jgi:hypothetical protein
LVFEIQAKVCRHQKRKIAIYCLDILLMLD